MHRPVTTFNPTKLVVAIALLTLAAACSGAADSPPADVDLTELAYEMIASGNVRLVDLTYPLSPDSIYWPTGSPFVHERLDWGINDAGFWYASASFASPEHLGTHLDAPVHFGEGQWTNAEIPVERLFARAALIDISERAAADPDAMLETGDIEAWEQRNGPIQEGSVVIVRSGWARHWPDWNAYYGSETPEDVTTLHFPGFSADAAAALGARGVVGVGIDTASTDPGISSSFEAHRVLATSNIYGLENLMNLDGLPETGFAIVALPMKIEGGSGGPTRVVAVVPR